MAGPLQGVKVLDLSRVLAGPWCGQLLADLGADVIKIERPIVGDDTRGWGPPFLKDADGNETEESAYYLSTNRGKRSIAVDITKPEGQAVIKRIAATCDILVENFKVGGLDKYGLDYASIHKEFPALIYCSITGFGHDGPLAPRAGYDFMIQAMGGLMSVTGEKDGAADAGPQKVGIAISDIVTGLYSCIGILAALRHKDHTGQGQHIDMSLLDTTVGLLGNQNLNYLVGGMTPQRMGNAHASIVPYQSFSTKDGHIILAAGNDRQFAAFCTVSGHAGLCEIDEYKTNRGRVEHRDILVPLVAQIMMERTTGEWIDLLEGAAVPCGPVNTIDKALNQPQIKARGLLMDMEHPLSGTVPQVGNPIKFSETKIEYHRPPPMLGQHCDEIMNELGFSSDEISKLKEKKILD